MTQPAQSSHEDGAPETDYQKVTSDIIHIDNDNQKDDDENNSVPLIYSSPLSPKAQESSSGSSTSTLRFREITTEVRQRQPRITRRIGDFLVNHVLPIKEESDEDRLTMGPIAKMIKYRRLPFKLILDLIMLLCVIVITLSAFGQKKKFLAASTDAFVQTFLPEGYESLTDNSEGLHTYYYKSVPDVLSSIESTVNKYYSLVDNSVDIYELIHPAAAVVASLNKTELSYQTESFLVLTTRLRKTDMRRLLTDNEQSIKGATRIASYDRDDAVHSMGNSIEYNEILNRTHPYSRLLNSNMDPRELRYNFDRLISSEIEFSVQTLDVGSQLLKRKAPIVECIAWTVRLKYDFNLRSALLPLQIRYNYSGCKQLKKNSVKTESARPYFWFALLLAICTLLSAILTLRAMIIRGKLWAKHRRELGRKYVSVARLFQGYVGWWYMIMLVRDLLNILGAIFILFIREREGSRRSRESINITNDFLSGLGGMLTCICLIRYLQFNAKFYVLILTLQKGLPDVLRFCCGVFPLFVAYALAGTTWFGHYVRHFQTIDETSVTLFSAIAGDMLRENYDMISGFNNFFKYAGRIYLTTFVTLYVYSVLNIFLVIVGEAYSILRQQIEEGMRQERLATARRQSEMDEEMNLYRATQTVPNQSISNIDEKSVEQQYVVSLTDAILQKIKDRQNGIIKSDQSKLLGELERIALQLVKRKPEKASKQGGEGYVPPTLQPSTEED